MPRAVAGAAAVIDARRPVGGDARLQLADLEIAPQPLGRGREIGGEPRLRRPCPAAARATPPGFRRDRRAPSRSRSPAARVSTISPCCMRKGWSALARRFSQARAARRGGEFSGSASTRSPLRASRRDASAASNSADGRRCGSAAVAAIAAAHQAARRGRRKGARSARRCRASDRFAIRGPRARESPAASGRAPPPGKRARARTSDRRGCPRRGAGMRDGGAVAAEIAADLRQAQAEMHVREIHRRLPREGRRRAAPLSGPELRQPIPSAADTSVSMNGRRCHRSLSRRRRDASWRVTLGLPSCPLQVTRIIFL